MGHCPYESDVWRSLFLKGDELWLYCLFFKMRMAFDALQPVQIPEKDCVFLDPVASIVLDDGDSQNMRAQLSLLDGVI